MSDWFRLEADGAVTICVHAQPGARRTEVAGLHGDSVRIRVAAPALEDRANEALVDFVAGALRRRAPRRDPRGGGEVAARSACEIRGSALDPAAAMGL